LRAFHNAYDREIQRDEPGLPVTCLSANDRIKIEELLKSNEKEVRFALD